MVNWRWWEVTLRSRRERITNKHKATLGGNRNVYYLAGGDVVQEV